MYPIRPTRCRFSPAVRVAVLLATIGIHAQAVTVNMVNSNTVNGQSWLTPATWSDGVAAHSGADYVVGANQLLRSPNSGTSPFTFPGDSLNMSGQFNLASVTGSVITVNNLTLSEGVLVSAIAGTNAIPSVQSLNGTLEVGFGTSFVKSTGTTLATGNDARNIVLNAQISGSTQATVHFLRNGTFSLTNPLNTFSGTWKAGGVNLSAPGANPSPATYSNNSTSISTLKATADGSLGLDASVVLDIWSRFDIDYAWITTGSLTLENNAGPYHRRRAIHRRFRVRARDLFLQRLCFYLQCR
jgi:hypothetical protein